MVRSPARKAVDSIAYRLGRMRERFTVKTSDGPKLSGEDDAAFDGIVAEALALFDHHLGQGNQFSIAIAKALRDTDYGGFFGGPSTQCLRTVLAVVEAGRSAVDRDVNTVPRSAGVPYVSTRRLDELRSARSPAWDLRRLVRLCEELNAAHTSESLMSIAMVVRAIIDHVPPIFGKDSFSEVANQHGARSFKGAMCSLEQSLRHIADAHLHVRIRAREVLPEPQQVDFRQPLDLLLSEVVRLVGKAKPPAPRAPSAGGARCRPA